MKFNSMAFLTDGKTSNLFSFLLLLIAGAFLTGCNVSAFAQKATPEEEYQNQVNQSRLRWADNLCSYLTVPEKRAEVISYQYDRLSKAEQSKITLAKYTRQKWRKFCVDKKLTRITKMRKYSDERKTAQLLKERLEAKQPE